MYIMTSIKIINVLILLAFCQECWNFDLLPLGVTNDDERILELFANIEYAAQHLFSEAQLEKGIPNDCSQREKSKKQPIYNSNSRLKKCCPIGESINIIDESLQHCYSTSRPFDPDVITAVLYDNCIEDIEQKIRLPYEIGNPCNMSFLFSDRSDVFYVLQDGSLLVMDEYSNETYSVENKYCLDVDNFSGNLYAIVCITSVEEQLNRSQVLVVGVLMLVSIPCLLVVSFLHVLVKDLRTVHGLSLSLMSLCLAAGYFLHSFAHIFNISSLNLGYAIQWFILSYFCWFFCLCCNVFLNIWYYIPLCKRITKIGKYRNFLAYVLMASFPPTGLVALTVQKGLQGMPSYFIQGFTESIRESQRYFIPPVSGILFLSFIIMTISFFGFQKIKSQTEENKDDSTLYISINSGQKSVQYDEEKYEEVKKDAKCISLLLLIMVTTWLLEVVTFYSPGPENYLIFMEMINGLQGVFILLIFVVVRRRRTIIIRWWYDRGSHNIENIELSEAMSSKSLTSQIAQDN